MKKINVIWSLFLSALLIFSFVGCSSSVESTEEEQTFLINYISSYGTAPVKKEVKKGYTLTENDLPSLTYAGYTFNGWTDYNGIFITAGFEITDNITLTASWTKNTDPEPEPEPAPAIEDENCQIVYASDLGTPLDPKTVKKGYKLTEEDLPSLTISGWTFEGWTLNGNPVEAGYEVTGYTYLVAKWTENAPEENDTQVRTPVISSDKEYLTSSDVITITCETAGASIYYTFDGSVPTAESSRYGGGLNLPVDSESESVTLTVVAIKEGLMDSEAVTKQFKYKRISDFTLDTEKAKKEYTLGSSFDKTGITATVKYNDGTQKDVSESVEYSGFDSSATNPSQEITVKYAEDTKTYTKSFSVRIYSENRNLDKIEVTALPEKTSYYLGDEFKSSGLVVTASYTDGTSSKVSDYTTTGFDSSTPGEKTITVTYTEEEITKTTTFDVSIRTLSSISATALKSSLRIGENFTSSDVRVTAYYTDNATRTVTNITVEGFSTTSVGSQTVTVKYQEGTITKSTTVTVETDSRYVFGEYPQTIKSSSVTITEEQDERGYYKGSDGAYYAKVISEGPETDMNGAYGRHYSDNTSIIKGSEVYFKVEPIEWTVLTTNFNSTGKALLVASKVLDAGVPFYVGEPQSNAEYQSAIRKINGAYVYPNNYEYSTVRAFLNGYTYIYQQGESESLTDENIVTKDEYLNKGFLQLAFSTDNIEKIFTTSVTNSEATTQDSGKTITAAPKKYRCGTLTDKVFLLSEQNVTSTGFGFAKSPSASGAGNKRIRFSTDYAKAKGVFLQGYESYGTRWMLRSPASTADSAVHMVEIDGDATDTMNGTSDSADIGIVPAITMDIFEQ